MTTWMPTSTTTFADLAISLQENARQYRHRRMVLIEGSADGSREIAAQITQRLALEASLWVGEAAPAGIPLRRNSQAHEALGGEVDLIVYDAFSGFDPDAFGALGGALRGGGLLLLLTPPLAQWQHFADPEYRRIAVAGTATSSYSGRFLQRLVMILQTDPWLVRFVERDRLTPIHLCQHTPKPRPSAGEECLTSDQQQAVTAIERVAKGHRRRPLVISSDRGRGKSSALGIAAARLMRERPRRILVTAPRRSAVDALFQQAAALMPDATVQRGDLHLGDSILTYTAPDHLLQTTQSADLLLVDEAAAIPTALLDGLLTDYPRVVFATTLHGYEGTGRGFALRFKSHLDRETPQWRELRLRTPIRWADDDPLEPLLFRLLGLDANPADEALVAMATTDSVELLQPDSAWLLQHESVLQQLFGLLVLAHYRTTPLDFRLLLDAPNLRTLLLCHDRQVVGVALLSAEGGFDPPLAQEIWSGQRRPRGHLLAQSLGAHVGLASAPCLKGLRIVRIAIHPAAQRRGLGSRLLAEIGDYARDQGFDYLGSSFGLSETLFDFWRRNGLQPVRLGLRTGTSSGDHSLLMVSPLSAEGEAMTKQAVGRFARQLPALLGDPLRELSASLAARLLLVPALVRPLSLEQDDWSDLAGFAFARRGYESCLPAIEAMTLWGVGDNALSQSERELLVLRVLQRREWAECARLNGLSGRAETEGRLRSIMAQLYRRFADESARRLMPARR
jgi:tRNA(Met) cytidine acetyltransferase